MLILGIDPATHKTGWALVAHERKLLASGIIKGGKGNAKQRIKRIAGQLDDVLEQHQPDIIIIEEPDNQSVIGRTSGAQAMLASLTYFIAGTLERTTLEYALVPVRQWKGNTPKRVVWNRLLEHYGDATPRSRGKYPWDNDAADALGIADWWIRNNEGRVRGCAPTGGG